MYEYLKNLYFKIKKSSFFILCFKEIYKIIISPGFLLKLKDLLELNFYQLHHIKHRQASWKCYAIALKIKLLSGNESERRNENAEK